MLELEERQNPFGVDYESRVVANLLRDRNFFYAWYTTLPYDYLRGEFQQILTKNILTFGEKYQRPPDRVELEVLIQEDVADRISDIKKSSEEWALLKDEIRQMFSFTATELEFTRDNALKYIQIRAVEKGILECAKLIGKPEVHKIVPIMEKALAVGTNVTNFGLDYFAESRRRALKRYMVPRETNRIPFFIPKLDEVVGGVGFRQNGSGIPELLMIGGGPNIGKSRVIAHMVKNAIALGLNGIVFSAEMAEDLYAERFDMALGLMSTAMLYQPENFDRLLRRITMYEHQGARFFIKKFPARSVTIAQTVAIARLIMTTLGIDLQWIAWDYAGEFKAENMKQERNHQVAEIISSQKRACDDLLVAGFGAFQLNRQGMGAEMADLEHAAEDISVARVADTVAIIAQTEEEYKMDPPEMRLALRKVRSSERNQMVRLIDDRRRMLFRQHPSEDGLQVYHES